jgi:FtsH-binding integral membrane protein
MVVSGTDVWDRSNKRVLILGRQLSRTRFVLSYTFLRLLGIAFMAIMAQVSYHWDILARPDLLVRLMIGMIAMLVSGLWLLKRSIRPRTSLAGYLLIAGGLGFGFGPAAGTADTASVVRVLFVVVALIVIFGVAGAFVPRSLEKKAIVWPCGILELFILGYGVVPFFGAMGLLMGGSLTISNWIWVGVLGGLVIFDLNRTMRHWHSGTPYDSIQASAKLLVDCITITVRLQKRIGAINRRMQDGRKISSPSSSTQA